MTRFLKLRLRAISIATQSSPDFTLTPALSAWEKTEDPEQGKIIEEVPVDLEPGAPVLLRIEVRGPVIDFAWSTDGESFMNLHTGADARTLSTMQAGGFVGAMVGMYAERDTSIVK